MHKQGSQCRLQLVLPSSIYSVDIRDAAKSGLRKYSQFQLANAPKKSLRAASATPHLRLCHPEAPFLSPMVVRGLGVAREDLRKNEVTALVSCSP